MNKEQYSITSTVVTGGFRSHTLSFVFGKHALWFESITFEWMRRLNKEYTGGHWEFYNLSNGGFYMGLDDLKDQPISSPNGFQDRVSADAASIIACLYALCNIANNTENDLMIERYHQLRDYALSHCEQKKIFAAID